MDVAGFKLRQPSDVGTEIVKELLNYFVQNQHAVDSLEGLTRWRLLEEQVHRTVQETEPALRWLVAEAFLEEVRPTGSVSLFRLDPNRLADAIKFLAEERKAEDLAE
jgi:hypothetical protein